MRSVLPIKSFIHSTPMSQKAGFFNKSVENRGDRITHLLSGIGKLAVPYSNDILFSAFPVSNLQMTRQYLTCYGAANYAQYRGLTPHDIPVTLNRKFADELCQQLDNHVERKTIEKKITEFMSDQPLTFLHEGTLFAEENPLGLREKIKKIYSVLSCLAQMPRMHTKMNGAGFSSDEIWEYTRQFTINSEIRDLQLAICNRYGAEVIRHFHDLDKALIPKSISDSPLQAILLCDSYGGLEHCVTNNRSHGLLDKLFTSDNMFPLQEIYEETSILVPNWLHRNDGNNHFEKLINTTSMMHLANHIAYHSGVNTVILDRNTVSSRHYPLILERGYVIAYVSKEPAFNYSKEMVRTEEFEERLIRLKDSPLHIRTNLGGNSTISVHAFGGGNSMSLMNSYNETKAAYAFTVQPRANKLYINHPGIFEPFKTWNTLDTYLVNYTDKSPYSGNPLVLAQSDEGLLEMDYAIPLPLHTERCEQRPPYTYGHFYPTSNTFSIIDRNQFTKKNSPPLQRLLEDVHINTAPVPGQHISFFP